MDNIHPLLNLSESSTCVLNSLSYKIIIHQLSHLQWIIYTPHRVSKQNNSLCHVFRLHVTGPKSPICFFFTKDLVVSQVVEVLTESLTLKETSIPTKVARLMLVSDIIHNSSARVKNASAYRTKFEATLPDIMESFNDLYHSVHGRITAEALRVIPESKYSSYVVLYPLKFCSHSYFVQERVLKVLQVWADWFLFSDAYINGLRATFLRSRNFGVTSFHSICGDAPDIEKKGLIGNMNDADKINQDAALAMGEGAARQELMNRPISELERRCRHNGLSLLGGREMMVARLVCLKDAEKQRGYEVVDENAKYRQGHSTWEEVNIEPKRMKTSYDKVETEEPVDLASTIPIPQPELKAFVKKEKIDLILPTSRWAREDDETDDEQKKSYSSGSDNAGGITFKTDEEDLKADPSVRVQPENEIDVEQRYDLHDELCSSALIIKEVNGELLE